MTLANTNEVTNVPAPWRAPIETSKPLETFSAATMLDITSGAPLPNAKNVTPARFWLIFRRLDNAVNAHDKYLFAVFPVR